MITVRVLVLAILLPICGQVSAEVNSGCCVGRVGDVNNDHADVPTIGDISMLIDAKFITGDCSKIACLAEADINQSGGCRPTCDDLTLGDITQLICYLVVWDPVDPCDRPACLVCP